MFCPNNFSFIDTLIFKCQPPFMTNLMKLMKKAYLYNNIHKNVQKVKKDLGIKGLMV